MSRDSADNEAIGSLLKLRRVHEDAAENAPDPETAGMHGQTAAAVCGVIALIILFSVSKIQ